MAGEEACHCLYNKESDQWIRNCKLQGEGKQHACYDFATKEHRRLELQEPGQWQVVEAGQKGCTPCKYVHPGLALPRGGQ